MAATLALAACATAPKPVAPPSPSPPAPALAQPLLPPSADAGCDAASAYQAAAAYNDSAAADLPFSLFGRVETGWAVYGPQIAEALPTRCAPDTPGFAEAAARWQAVQGLTPSGAVTADTLQALKGVWQQERPFVLLRVAGICPAGADEAILEPLRADEIFGDKTVLMRPAALAALRRMVAAARLDLAEARADPDLLKAFSGYRSPAADASRCQSEHNCQGMVRAQCSAHRTGLAVDLNVGFAPGFLADGSADANRLVQSRTATYRWLVRNAARFGFVNYVFEPWHWEWTGQAP